MKTSWNERHLLRDTSQPLPWPLHCAGIWLLAFLRSIIRCWAPPMVSIMDISFGAWRQQVLYTVASLGIADILAKGPQTAQQIASKIGGNTWETYRVLRAAVQIELFTISKDPDAEGQPRFQNNRLSALLREDHPNCLKHMVTSVMDLGKEAQAEQPWRVLTGGNCFEKTHGGTGPWDWLQAHPALEHGFSKAMAECDSLGALRLLKDYKWTKFSRIIDVGGAYGSFLEALLTANKRSSMTGVLFDMPQVVERAEQVWQQDKARSVLLSRVKFCGGSFFAHETIPPGEDGDVWVLRHILHDWNDAKACAILSNLRRAIGSAKVTLVIGELSIVHEFRDPVYQRGLSDLHMQCVHDGAERNVQQWKEMFAASGFRFQRLVETRGPFSVVEAVPQ